jgi:hypothetical protein
MAVFFACNRHFWAGLLAKAEEWVEFDHVQDMHFGISWPDLCD